MPQITRQISVNITASNVWTMLARLHNGSNYTVPGVIPSANRGDLRWIRFNNFGANDATVELAICPGPSPLESERAIPPTTVQPNSSLLDDHMYTIPPTFGVWARVNGINPNVTVMGNVLEITS